MTVLEGETHLGKTDRGSAKGLAAAAAGYFIGDRASSLQRKQAKGAPHSDDPRSEHG